MTHVGASFVALAPAFYNSQSVLTPPLLLSKSQPLTLGCDLVLDSSPEAGVGIYMITLFLLMESHCNYDIAFHKKQNMRM